MSLTRLVRTSLLCGLVATGSFACGDDDGGDNTDNSDVDGGDDDPDAGPGPSISGEILFLEVSFEGLEQMGSGILTIIGPFIDNEDKVAPVFEEAPGSPFACKVWEKSPAEFTDLGRDIGTISFGLSEGPNIPDFDFVPDVGWIGIGAMGDGTVDAGVDFEAGPEPPLAAITDVDVTLGDDQVGRVVQVEGAAEAANNGIFPIVGAVEDNTILIVNPDVVEEIGSEATYMTIQGFGPAGQVDPFPDDAVLSVSLDSDDDAYGDFSITSDVGDSFTLDDDTAALIVDIPTDGAEFSLSCDGEGGECNEALATAINIDITDGDTEGFPPFILPPPATKGVTIFCIFLVPTAVIPAEASEYIETFVGEGATRARTIYVRGQPTDVIQDKATGTIVTGHARGGFTNFPQK